MKKVLVFLLSAILFTSCVTTKKFKALESSCNQTQDSLRLALASISKENVNLEIRNDRLMQEGVTLRADSTSKNRQIINLTQQNSDLKQLNENLSAKQSKLIQQSTIESQKMLEELQSAREILQKREDALDEERKNLDKIRKELGIKDDEILLKNKQLADMEELVRKKDSATVALRTKIEKALIGFEGQGLTIEQRNGKIYVLLDEALLFKVGQSDVGDKGQEALKKLAAVLEQNPDINITVEGHTDITGGEKLNWQLSTKRALAISFILLDNSKIAGKRITVSGRGQYVPIDNANTVEARAKNRRSEIILTPDLQELYNIIQGK